MHAFVGESEKELSFDVGDHVVVRKVTFHNPLILQIVRQYLFTVFFYSEILRLVPQAGQKGNAEVNQVGFRLNMWRNVREFPPWMGHLKLNRLQKLSSGKRQKSIWCVNLLFVPLIISVYTFCSLLAISVLRVNGQFIRFNSIPFNSI